MTEKAGTWTKQMVEDYLYILGEVHNETIALEMLKLVYNR